MCGAIVKTDLPIIVWQSEDKILIFLISEPDEITISMESEEKFVQDKMDSECELKARKNLKL